MNTFFSDLCNTKGMRIAFLAVCVMLAGFLFMQIAVSARDFGRSGVSATDVITVQGNGRATLAPDVARISFTVEQTNASVSEAQEAATRQSNAALEYLKGQHIDKKDIKTQMYSIYPQYTYPNPCSVSSSEACPAYGGTPKITGYRVSQSIQVTVHDLSTVGTLLSGLGKIEVQNISGPDFGLNDASAGYDAARADAIAKAKSQAFVLSKQLGVHLGKIVNFSESSGGYNYPMYKAMDSMSVGAAAPTPQVPTGENTYTASVSITYEIR